MKFLLENWQKYLNEQEKSFPYQIYCDMDGVLVDFLTGALNQINKDLKDETIVNKSIDKLRKKLSELGRDQVTPQDLDKMDKENRLQAARNYMYRRFENNEKFWADLPWAEGGKELWSYISQFDPYILTAPMKGEGSKRGKEIWIENNLNPIKPPKKIFMSHQKDNWAVTDGKPNVLIDDFTINIEPWNNRQKALDLPRLGILHTSVESTIAQLEELKNETLI